MRFLVPRAMPLLLAVALSVAGCTLAAPSASPGGLVTGTLTGGPTCPVETVPPDPACAPKLVAGATVVARDETGREVARTVSGADGRYALALPHGTFVVVAEPVAGYFGVSDPVRVEVDARDIARVADFTYETGIR